MLITTTGHNKKGPLCRTLQFPCICKPYPVYISKLPEGSSFKSEMSISNHKGENFEDVKVHYCCSKRCKSRSAIFSRIRVTKPAVDTIDCIKWNMDSLIINAQKIEAVVRKCFIIKHVKFKNLITEVARERR